MEENVLLWCNESAQLAHTLQLGAAGHLVGLWCWLCRRWGNGWVNCGRRGQQSRRRDDILLAPLSASHSVHRYIKVRPGRTIKADAASLKSACEDWLLQPDVHLLNSNPGLTDHDGRWKSCWQWCKTLTILSFWLYVTPAATPASRNINSVFNLGGFLHLCIWFWGPWSGYN